MKCIVAVVMLAFAAHASVIEQTGSGLLNQYSSISSSGGAVYHSAPEYHPVVVEARSAPAVYTVPAQLVEVRAAPTVHSSYSAPSVYSAPLPSKVIEIQAPAPAYNSYAQGRSAEYHSGVASAQVVEVRVAPASAPVHHYPQVRSAHVVKSAQPLPKYTAVNQGALHEAALPGYTADQTSVNLESAPGTW